MENLVRSIRGLQQRLHESDISFIVVEGVAVALWGEPRVTRLVSTRLRDHEDAASVVRRQRDKLDDRYVLHWLRQFGHALNDSTLVAEYTRLQAGG